MFLRNEGKREGLFRSTWIFNYGDKFVRGVNKKFNSGKGGNIREVRSVLFYFSGVFKLVFCSSIKSKSRIAR